MSVFDILIHYWPGILDGLKVTLQLCLLIWVFGLVGGTLLGIVGAKWRFSFGAISWLGSFTLSGLPVLVFLFWLHYPLQVLLGVVIEPFWTAAAALSIINMFAIAEIVRNVLRDFPSQYMIAAQVCGLSAGETLWHIQLPIAFRQILPGLLMTQVNMLQATLFASLISVDEIFRVAQRINAIVYRPVEVYTALGFLFLSICLPLNGLALWLRQRYTRDLSER